MKDIRLVQPMYPCQNIPALIFENSCPRPCLYCGLSGRIFSPEKIIAVGEGAVLKALTEFKSAYFSPTSDCFLTENADLTHYLLKEIWRLKPDFVPLVNTKQIIPEETIALFAANRRNLVLQISVPGADEEIIKILEPGSALISERLLMLKRLRFLETPLIVVVMPWFNLDEKIETLPRSLANVGVSRAIIATGVLSANQRQRMISSENEKIKSAALMTQWVEGGTKNGYVLPRDIRADSLKLLTAAFEVFGIKAVVCTSDNHDLDPGQLPLCTKFKHHNFKD